MFVGVVGVLLTTPSDPLFNSAKKFLYSLSRTLPCKHSYQDSYNLSFFFKELVSSLPLLEIFHVDSTNMVCPIRVFVRTKYFHAAMWESYLRRDGCMSTCLHLFKVCIVHFCNENILCKVPLVLSMHVSRYQLEDTNDNK